MRLVTKALLVLTVLGAVREPARAQSPTTFDACYVPSVGALYLINLSGLPTACLASSHVPISWSTAGDHGALAGLTDDDHPQYLLADGLRTTTNGFAVTGTFGTGTIPATGAGVRLMWYPAKAAFRVGRAATTEWDDASVGPYSIVLGTGTATGTSATALGALTAANGDQSTAMGSGTQASGSYSAALGLSTTAQSYASLVIGSYNVIAGNAGTWVSTDPLLVAGNGTGTGVLRSNALTLYKNGNMTIAGTLSENSDIRLKEDVEPLGQALNGVVHLTPIRYRFREGTGHPTEPQIGLSAEEVRQAFPELVSQDAQGYLSVAYPNMAAVLVRAVQEQQAQIAALEGRIAELEARLAARP